MEARPDAGFDDFFDRFREAIEVPRFSIETAAGDVEPDLVRPEERPKHAQVRTIQGQVPDGWSGYGAVRSVPRTGRAGRGIVVPSASWIAFHGRQKSQ